MEGKTVKQNGSLHDCIHVIVFVFINTCVPFPDPGGPNNIPFMPFCDSGLDWDCCGAILVFRG